MALCTASSKPRRPSSFLFFTEGDSAGGAARTVASVAVGLGVALSLTAFALAVRPLLPFGGILSKVAAVAHTSGFADAAAACLAR